jgi:hypothetical protein
MAAESNLGVGCVDLREAPSTSGGTVVLGACAPAFPAIANKIIKSQSISPPVVSCAKA